MIFLLQAATILAKQLVQLRKQKTKTYQVGSRIQSVGTQAKVITCEIEPYPWIKLSEDLFLEWPEWSKTISTFNIISYLWKIILEV